MKSLLPARTHCASYRPLTGLLTLFLVLLAATGCSTGDRTGAVRVLLLDASSSTDKPAIRDLYQRTATTVIGSGQGGDAFAAYPVTGNSQATSFDEVEVKFPAYDPLTENEDQHTEEEQAAQSKAASGVQRLIGRKDTGQGTDLLYAFDKAAGLFNGEYRRTPDKELLVLTDGFQQAGSEDFLRDDLTSRRTREIIAALRARGRLPRLTGVRVWMVGCGADPYREVGAEKIDQVRRFWIAYFAACGADMAPERCGTTLEDYPAGTP